MVLCTEHKFINVPVLTTGGSSEYSGIQTTVFSAWADGRATQPDPQEEGQAARLSGDWGEK